MLHHPFVNDILVLVGGLFLYGIRAAVGKWLVANTFKVLRRLLVRSEEEVKLYHEFLREELAKKRR
jgi:hypothetical protein